MIAACVSASFSENRDASDCKQICVPVELGSAPFQNVYQRSQIARFSCNIIALVFRHILQYAPN